MAAATKTVIQKSNTRATIKVASLTATGADTSTISLTTDLAYTSGEGTVQTVVSPKANISKIWYSVPSGGYVTITRNSVIVATLFGHDVIEGFNFAENNGSDIAIAFSAGGTVILEINKIDGYGQVLEDR